MSPVFDEAKYRALLEKLEISEVNLSDLEKSIRLDSEFYSKAYLQLQNTLEKLKSKPLNEYCVSISDGNHMSISAFFSEDGIPYYRGQDIYNFFIEQSPCPLRVPEEIFNAKYMKRSHLHQGDILMSIVGAIIGNIAIVSEKFPAVCSCKLAIIRPQPAFKTIIAFFLKSSFGHRQIERLRRGGGQTGFLLEDFPQLQMPDFTVDFRKKVDSLATDIYDKYLQAINCYKTAEHLLLQELGLMDWQPDNESVATKTFADFQNSGRLDAEYYQPKYDDLFKRISSYDKSRLGDIVNITKSIEPGSEAYQEDGVPFVRVSDITKFGITSPEIHLDRDKYYSENLTPKKDTILLSKDGSVGIAYKVENDLDVITSGALLHLTVKNNDFLPDYLTLVLNSIVVKLQAERDAGGSIIQHWKPSEIENVIIPKLPMAIQEQIASKVQESFALRKESKRLLDLAKHAVEVAIEQGEDAAMNLLEGVKNA